MTHPWKPGSSSLRWLGESRGHLLAMEWLARGRLGLEEVSHQSDRGCGILLHDPVTRIRDQCFAHVCCGEAHDFCHLPAE
jgi:hypothetical protein